MKTKKKSFLKGMILGSTVFLSTFYSCEKVEKNQIEQDEQTKWTVLEEEIQTKSNGDALKTYVAVDEQGNIVAADCLGHPGQCYGKETLDLKKMQEQIQQTISNSVNLIKTASASVVQNDFTTNGEVLDDFIDPSLVEGIVDATLTVKAVGDLGIGTYVTLLFYDTNDTYHAGVQLTFSN